MVGHCHGSKLRLTRAFLFVCFGWLCGDDIKFRNKLPLLLLSPAATTEVVVGELRNHATRRSGSRVFPTSLEARSEVEKKTALVLQPAFICNAILISSSDTAKVLFCNGKIMRYGSMSYKISVLYESTTVSSLSS